MTDTLFVLRYRGEQRALLNQIRAMLAKQCPDALVECVEAVEPSKEHYAEIFAAVQSTKNVAMINLDDPQQTPEQIVNRVKGWLL